ncbi:MAG: glycyl-radical enzyme activating protein [Fimbriimonadaceae bacterium]|nr:glycyl-radical enzyme activating protein [Fimbriimonadaceae bacterium]
MATPTTPLRGRVFDVQRFSIHDGPGIRTTVFLKGCPLRCVWCHNPEAVSRGPQLSYLAARCIACGACVEVCPQGAHTLVGERHRFDRAQCEVCGACAAACCTQALELVGRDATVDEILDEVLRDRIFYDSSGGGMTLSGGEPLAQLEFAAALLTAARRAGVATAVETCGYVPPAHLEQVRPLVDLFLFDLKETDPARHAAWCGQEPARILANLQALHDRGAAIWLRLPLVPGLNARPDHFAAVAAQVRALPRLQAVEVMPYHRLGSAKRERLGLPATDAGLEPPSAELVADWIAALRALGVPVREASGGNA